MPKIKVTVSKLGDSKVDVIGATGEGCLSLTAGIERALSGQEAKRELKPEFNEVVVEQTQENS